ncbi:arylsulfatase [Mariniphaga sediminis]|uniref:Arylsulfatase n=1 Tax=Mariniphaga sediminis TaxID=1628158 RepID=A0A399D0A4_9BACT|nr:arylsulfatase [Mariniphaga sediminis]RIH65109.1 arylsulfatase [Mariniphaga sediminis]
MKLSWVTISFFASILYLFSLCNASASGNSPLPNIVIIFADDMGYGDVSALNPAARTQTPAIDKLVDEGITFTEAHASASVCTPSRYGLLTGRYAFRSEHAAHGIGGFTPPVIEPERKTLATLLKNAGYTTACIGKWHLGLGWQTNNGKNPGMDWETGWSNVDFSKEVTSGPNDYGFDYSFIHPASLDIPPYVFLRNHKAVDADMILTTDHYPARLENTEYAWDKKHTNDLAVYWEKGVWWRQGEMSRSFRVENCLSEITKEGVRFIEKQVDENPDKPFFLYLPLTAPHTPWMPSEQSRGKSSVGLYGDFVLDVDHTVEQIKQALIRNGITKNTMLIFSSDNGAYWPQEEIELYAHDSNQGRKGQKGDVWDGGHRIPLIISWPEKIKKAASCKQLVSLTDFFATFCHLTGQKPEANQAEDSFSFWHVLNGETEKVVRESMVHHSSDGFYGIRMGNWKFIDGLGSGGFSYPTKLPPVKKGPSGQLYNMKEDVVENNNIYFQHPEKVAELSSLMNEIIEKGHIRGK